MRHRTRSFRISQCWFLTVNEFVFVLFLYWKTSEWSKSFCMSWLWSWLATDLSHWDSSEWVREISSSSGSVLDNYHQCSNLGVSMKVVSSLTTSFHYLWRSLGPFSLPRAQKWHLSKIYIHKVCLRDLTQTVTWGFGERSLAIAFSETTITPASLPMEIT